MVAHTVKLTVKPPSGGSATIEVLIDLEAIARQAAAKALANKTGKARLLEGAVKAKVTKRG